MKLKSYNKENIPNVRDHQPTIRINHKGIITINNSAAERMGLAPGDSIEFHQDEDHPKDWYVSKGLDLAGFPLRSAKATSGLLINSAGLTKKIFNALGINNGSIRIPVGSETIKEGTYTLYPLITAAAKGRETA